MLCSSVSHDCLGRPMGKRQAVIIVGMDLKIALYVVTYRDVNVQSSGNSRFQMVIQHNRSELDFVSWFVYSFVGLDEHRITLVNVFECRGVKKL